MPSIEYNAEKLKWREMEERLKIDVRGAAEKLREIAEYLEEGEVFEDAAITMKIVADSGEIMIRLIAEAQQEQGYGDDFDEQEEIIIEDDSELV